MKKLMALILVALTLAAFAGTASAKARDGGIIIMNKGNHTGWTK